MDSLLNNQNANAAELIELAKNYSTKEQTKQCCDQLDALLLPWLKYAKQDRHSDLTNQALKFLDSTNYLLIKMNDHYLVRI